MNKDFIPQNIPFFPIGLKPCKVNLSEIGLQFSSESLTALPTKSNFTYHYPVGRGGFGRV